MPSISEWTSFLRSTPSAPANTGAGGSLASPSSSSSSSGSGGNFSTPSAYSGGSSGGSGRSSGSGGNFSMPAAYSGYGPHDGTGSTPSWMGNMYSQVPGTSWYSTNPENPNSSKFTADGRPVATVGYDNQRTGQSYHGYATPEQFQQITSGGSSAGTSNTLSGMLSSGQLNMPQSMVYNPSGGYANTPMSGVAAKTPAPSYNPTLLSANAKINPYKTDTLTPNMPMSYDPFGTLTPGGAKTGSVNSPAMPAISRWNVNAPYQDRLARFKSNPNDAQNELLSLKQMYDGANGNSARQAEITGWADQVRQAAGIRDNNATFGNNNGLTPAQQQANIDLFTKSQDAPGPGIGNGVVSAPVDTVKKDQGIPNQVDKTTGLYQDPYVRTPEQIAALAKSQSDAIVQGGRTAAQGSLLNAKNAFDYSQKTTQGNRALLQFDNSNRGDQFGGSAREDKFRLDRQQGIEDTAANNQYTAQVAQINQKLADLEAAAPGQQQKIIDDLQQIERTTGINVAHLQEQQKQNQLQAQHQNFTEQQAVKQQHIDLANALSQQFGVPVNPTDDPMQSYAQVAGLSTVAAKKLALDAANMNFDNVIKKALAENTINKSQADIMHQAQQISISQQNANTSAASSSNSNNNANQTHLIEVWKATGKAPAGITGVAEGTSYVHAPTTSQNNNQALGKLTSDIDKMTPENRKKFFTDQKSNIIAEHNITGYNELYNMYFDKNGDPK